MKKLLLIGLILLGTVGMADSLERCKLVSEIAGDIMGMRQSGMEMSKLYEFTHKKGVPALSKVTDLMIDQAYQTPKFSTKEVQKEEVTEFKNRWFYACMIAAKERQKK